jgi:uncharacterized repeat protein (TIGR01451 family)
MKIKLQVPSFPRKILFLISFVFFIQHANSQITNCEGPLTLTVTPPQPVGGYAPGTTVNFCFSLDGYSQTGVNWVHGMGIDFGPGWDTATFNPYAPATSCDGMGNWAWYSSCTSSNSGVVFGPGFYYDSPSGATTGTLDGDPGNNYGDNCQVNVWTFCWTIQTSSVATVPIPLTGTVFITSDGVSGSWGTSGCAAYYISFNALLGGSSCAASFFYTTIPVENVPLNLYNASYGINPAYLWTFGDGDSSNLLHPVHTYAPDGNYTACLYVSDSTGCSDSICINLSVGDDYWWSNLPYYIEGTVFYDADSNGVMGLYEPGLQNQALHLQPVNNTTFSHAGGDFHFPANDGDYVLTAVPPPGWALTSDSAAYHIHLDSLTGSLTGFNFGFKPGQYVSQFQLSLDEGNPTCLWTTYQTIDVTNTGTNFLNGVISYVKHDSVNVMSVSQPADSVIQNVYYWHYTHLAPFQHAQITLGVDKPGTIGLPFWSIAYADVRDTLNTILLSQADTANEIVTCSFDPNEKIVSPVTTIDGQNYTLIGQTLTYTIRFQNTGTAAALNVAVIDTLPPSLSINSFHLISGSYPADVHYTQDGIITFIFYGINLPDSASDEPGSHGYVKFTADAIAGIANNTLVQNTASVYFDQNAPVQTTTASTTFVMILPTGISGNEIKNDGIYIYPNPSGGKITVTSFTAPAAHDYLEVLDNTGKIILRQRFTNREQAVDLSGYSRGIYTLKIVQEKKVSTFKLVVE